MEVCEHVFGNKSVANSSVYLLVTSSCTKCGIMREFKKKKNRTVQRGKVIHYMPNTHYEGLDVLRDEVESE